MKKVLIFFISLIFSVYVYSQYPIQTIFKGDSVVILTIKQSNDINFLIDKQSILVENLQSQIKVLNEKLEVTNKEITTKDSIANYYKSLSDSIGKENMTLMDSIWNWSLGPSLIYSQYPDDSTMYILDLTRYYMTTDDFGIFMPRMPDKEFEKYVKYLKELKQNPPSFREFNNSSEFEIIGSEKIKRRKVWKHRLKK